MQFSQPYLVKCLSLSKRIPRYLDLQEHDGSRSSAFPVCSFFGVRLRTVLVSSGEHGTASAYSTVHSWKLAVAPCGHASAVGVRISRWKTLPGSMGDFLHFQGYHNSSSLDDFLSQIQIQVSCNVLIVSPAVSLPLELLSLASVIKGKSTFGCDSFFGIS